MKYSHRYSKLGKKEYTTIRRYKKGSVGDVKIETYPGGSHSVIIKKMERKALTEITTEFLLTDTDCATRKEAIALINSFYKKPIDEYKDKLYVYYLRRV